MFWLLIGLYCYFLEATALILEYNLKNNCLKKFKQLIFLEAYKMMFKFKRFSIKVYKNIELFYILE